jgi:hypothetical protein
VRGYDCLTRVRDREFLELCRLAVAHTKCGGRIMNCACTTRLNAMAAVTTASTRRFVRVIGLGIVASSARLFRGRLMAKLDVSRIAPIVASRSESRKGFARCPPSRFNSREVRRQAQSLRVGHQRDRASHQGGGYGDAVRPGHYRLHQVRDCRRGVTLMYAQASGLGVPWSTRIDGAVQRS